jgi:hypothetical protein
MQTYMQRKGKTFDFLAQRKRKEKEKKKKPAILFVTH